MEYDPVVKTFEGISGNREAEILKPTLHRERDEVSACLRTFLRLVSARRDISATGSATYPRPEFDIELASCGVDDDPASCWESHSKGADARDEEGPLD